MAGTRTQFGITVSFATGFCARIIGVNGPDLARAWIDTTCATSPNNSAEGQPGDIVDIKSLSVDIQHEPELTPPIYNALETVTITWPIKPGGMTAPTWAGSGCMISYKPKGTIRDKMTATVEINFTGALTYTAGT